MIGLWYAWLRRGLGAGGLCVAIGLGSVAALAQVKLPDQQVTAPQYQTMASEPDPRDFVTRAEQHLTLLGDTLRFGGFDIGWLGLRQDGTGPARLPTAFEVKDALATVQAMGGFVVRSRSLASSVGCALCLEPTLGQFNPQAFATLDLVLKDARDLGLKVILPLAEGAPACDQPARADMAAGEGQAGSLCAYVGWRGRSDAAAFFSDAQIRSDFFARVATILNHVNALTGVAYRNDPAILAWENCEACGPKDGDAAMDGAVADWSEALGQAIKAIDSHHLYEDGAFAGRIAAPRGQGAHAAVAPAQFATPSVDIVGDHLDFPHDTAAARVLLDQATAAAVQSGRVYILDHFGWGPGLWASQEDFSAMLDAIFRERQLTGLLVAGLEGHEDGGGYLPAPPGPHADGQAALYFPGITTPDLSGADMMLRDRVLRVFNNNMAGIMQTPAPLMPPQPQIIGVVHGHVVWRGAAGALDYTIERSLDPDAPGSWSVVCDRCVNDLSGGWQDPAPVAGAWYRVMPFNINGHKALPSEAVKGQ